MDKLAKLIEETSEVREFKRALSVKLGEEGMATEAMGAVLQVTPRAVRKCGANAMSEKALQG